MRVPHNPHGNEREKVDGGEALAQTTSRDEDGTLLEVRIQGKGLTAAVLTTTCGRAHHTCLLVLTHTLLEEVGLAFNYAGSGLLQGPFWKLFPPPLKWVKAGFLSMSRDGSRSGVEEWVLTNFPPRLRPIFLNPLF